MLIAVLVPKTGARFGTINLNIHGLGKFGKFDGSRIGFTERTIWLTGIDFADDLDDLRKTFNWDDIKVEPLIDIVSMIIDDSDDHDIAIEELAKNFVPEILRQLCSETNVVATSTDHVCHPSGIDYATALVNNHNS